MARLKKTILANDILDRPEIEILDEKFGNDGIVAMFACYFSMSGSATGKLTKEQVIRKAKKHRVKNAESWLEYCVSENIFTESGGNYTNSHVDSDRNRYKQKLESDRNRKKKSSGIRSLPDIDIDLDIEDLNKKGLIQHPQFPHCWYSEIDIDQFGKPKEFITRCFQKLNGWIEQAKGDPVEFQKRREIGAHGLTGAFQSWVIAAISREGSTGAVKQKVSAVERLEQRKFNEKVEAMEHGN